MKTTNETPKTLRIAAIQTRNREDQPEASRREAEGFIRQAAAKGAQMAFLPELFGRGYFLTDDLWDTCEPARGDTFRWMSALSRELGIWLGAGIVETSGDEVYNSYLLTAPSGELTAVVHKNWGEARYFRRGSFPRVVDTPLGRLGIAICADNHYKDLLEEYLREGVDLVVMPHAWFTPLVTGRMVSQQDVDEARQKALDMAPLYSRALGVPALFVNPVGPFSNQGERIPGLLGRLVENDKHGFPGLATISNAEGEVLARLEDQPGWIMAEMTLDPAKTHRTIQIPLYGKWVHPGPAARDLIFGVDVLWGKLVYRFSRRRRQAARAVQEGHSH